MSNFEGLYDIRPMVEADKSFILSTFLRGLYYGESWYTLIPKRIFMDNYKKVGEYLVTNPRCGVRVACLKEDADIIIGYSIISADQKVLHWLYVKSAWRKQGIARSLLPRLPESVTHLTKLGLELMKSKCPKETFFNPFGL